ncbi:MAG: haloacid dehalogenase-like hydrolase [Lachnospiraceae bacterium]|nr:haloacid dehalogenase-like hydrolase [Lachnospiraceae bacterium]
MAEELKKDNVPVLAICYDFNKTLSPDNMQAQGYIQSLNFEKAEEFWKKSDILAEENDMDQNLAYMYLMIEDAVGKFYVTPEKLRDYGSKVELYKGVDTWFRRIREFGEANGVKVEHYIISSGLKEMIEGTKIAGEFEKIYASAFYYNDKGSAVWPAQVVNFTNKTQFLFRIEKGVLDVNDDGVNKYYAPDELRVPFRNIVYIGDSETDVPCMKLVNVYGGHSIGVYDPDKQNKNKVQALIRQNRIKYYAPADYSEGSVMEELLHDIILKTAIYERLENKHIENLKEANK